MKKTKRSSRSTSVDRAKALQAVEPATTESVIVANKFILTDNDGKERASLFLQESMVMLTLSDSYEATRLLFAVTPDGKVLISATYRLDDGKLADSFRLAVSNGEPEIVLRDAVFKDCTTINPRGIFNS